MGLIWYSTLMPSLIFVCETKCFDGGWLLKRQCVYQRLFFFFLFWWRVRVLWPLTVQYTVCLLLKTRTQSIEFWIRFIIPPSSQQLCCQRAACVCVSMCLRERDVHARCVCLMHVRPSECVCVCACTCVVKVNYCKRLPINLLSWKFEWYCRMHTVIINTCVHTSCTHVPGNAQNTRWKYTQTHTAYH